MIHQVLLRVGADTADAARGRDAPPRRDDWML